MGDGFQVDFRALEAAATGINATLDDVGKTRTDALDAPAAAYGHDHLAETVSDFCARWQEGVQHLADSGREVAQRLNQCVQDYQKVDAAAEARLNGTMLQSSSGPDPAAH